MTLHETQALSHGAPCASMSGTSCLLDRRTLTTHALCSLLLCGLGGSRWAVASPTAGLRSADSAVALQGEQRPGSGAHPDRRWFDAAVHMRRLAESRGDQSYGAVLVLDGRLVGEGPSRVLELADSTAHAEREAIRDAQRRLKRADLTGSILYSTSRPCRACETAAAAAGVRRMYFGEALDDAGAPQLTPAMRHPGGA